ncbi:Kelch repeat-containing protein [Marinigracilibium pacificum]|uniref:Galactose oxidase n=1 Tax=Marinigracilibium pacificum TaxID=2729599 RepID=A0A848ISU4_9BACT|nr:kelch repeat-containing protein [Marinigracilibium pacificum]NMM47523.1 galactose oxidase [Marinigracilibium pacificum]
MNKFYFLLLAMILFACDDVIDDSTSEEGNWIRKSSFEGVGRSNPVVFTVEDKAFVGLGFDGDNFLIDFWVYDPDLNFWKRIADFPGQARTSAVAFSIGNKGYVGTGYNEEGELSDFYVYDVDADSWSRIADFGGGPRYESVAYSLGDNGYVGAGYNGNYLKDFWKYNPTNDSWDQIISIKGEKRMAANSFVIDGNAYIVTGSNNGILESDFWQYNPESVDWFELADLYEDEDYSKVRENGVAFALNGYGYLTTGNNGANLKSTYEYNPIDDTWKEKTSFEGVERQGAIGFTVKGRSFVGLGRNSSLRFDDIWEFIPFEEYNDED